MSYWFDAPDWKALDRGEILAAWRTHPSAVLCNVAGRFDSHLREALLAVTPEAALRQAPADTSDGVAQRTAEGRYALTVAQAVPEHLHDVRLSWILLAAIAGRSLVAHATMARVLREAGHGRLAVLWRRAAMDRLEQYWTFCNQPSILEARRQVLAETAMTEMLSVSQTRSAPPGSAVKTPSAPPPRLSYEPTRVVCSAIHDGGNKGIAQAYQSLTEPLPLAGCDVGTEALCDALDMEFPWLAEATQAVREDLALRRRAGSPWVRLRPLLLVGPPGTGKTRWARRLASLSGTGFGEIAGAGSIDNRSLAGTARGWGSANPAFPVQVVLRTRTANPVLVVDELEKAAGSGHNGRLHDTLLAMLEPETAAAWPDECLQTPVDLSQISWVCTANSLKGLPDPLQQRLRIVRTGEPAADDWPALLQGLLRDLAAELDVHADALPGLEPDAEAALRQAFERGAPVRKLKAALTSALAYGEAPEPERH